MNSSQNYTDLQKLTAKDIQYLLVSVSEKTAQNYFTDIKKEYQLKIVLFVHFKNYFKVS